MISIVNISNGDISVDISELGAEIKSLKKGGRKIAEV